jgi:F-type H+-transporting ATPase subunit delta
MREPEHMSSFNDKSLAIAKVYASAMIELAEQRGEGDDLGAELSKLAALVRENEDFRSFVEDPLADPDQRRESLEKVFRGRASELLVDSLQVLNRKGRIGILPAIAEVYDALLDALRQRVEVSVTSAVQLSDAQRRDLSAAVKTQTGRDARFLERVDGALLGGMVVQIGDRKIDTSVATRLQGLSAALLTRASREIQAGSHTES